MAFESQPTREDVEREYPRLMADFLLDRVLSNDLDAEEAQLMYQVLTDTPD
jgi:hypothetical protein